MLFKESYQLFFQDEQIDKEKFSSFLKEFSSIVSSLRIGARWINEDYEYLDDFGWILYFKNLEKFEISCNEFQWFETHSDNYDFVEDFCQNH